MGNFISGVLGGLIVGVLLLVVRPSGPAPASILAGSKPEAMEQRVDELSEQVQMLRVDSDPDTDAQPVREIVEDSELRRRVEALEAAIVELRRHDNSGADRQELSDDPDKARQLIDQPLVDADQRYDPSALARIPLRLEFLERWPRHAQAEDQLTDLVSDYKNTYQTKRALAAIDRFGPQTTAQAWELDWLRLSVTRSHADRLEIAMRLIQNSGGAGHRTYAIRCAAASLAELGRRDEAIELLEGLIAEYGRVNGMGSTVSYARRQRQSILEGR